MINLTKRNYSQLLLTIGIMVAERVRGEACKATFYSGGAGFDSRSRHGILFNG